jgi:LTXXQ motif family protein
MSAAVASTASRLRPLTTTSQPADRVPPYLAWRRHHHAAFVAWAGLVFWPYVYDDLFYYPFWPDAYDDDYWPYAYDDLMDSIYWATGNPYSDDDYAAPTAATVALEEQKEEPARRRRPGSEASGGAGQCQSSAGITDWPFAKIEGAVRPAAGQQASLDALKTAATQASEILKASCPHDASLTPTGRLQAMIDRLQAAVNAVRTVRAPLMTFYGSLSDEQKARFNALGPDAGPRAEARPGSAGSGAAAAAACPAQKPGLADLPIERITAAVHPAEAQQPRLDGLKEANGRAVAILQGACPDGIPQTPVGRLEAVETRLDAMLQAAKAIQPALQNFYSALTDEQKSRFNTLGQRPRGDG